jgi:hypothetical protein
MIFLKEVGEIGVWQDRHLEERRFTASQKRPVELAPGYWTTPTDRLHYSLNPDEDSQMSGFSLRLDFQKIKCIIIGDTKNPDKIIDLVIGHLKT